MTGAILPALPLLLAAGAAGHPALPLRVASRPPALEVSRDASGLEAGAASGIDAATTPPGSAAESLVFGRFGSVALYRDSPHPSRRVLFISGDGGWNLGVVDMARALASLDSLVVGVDITHYLKELAASEVK